jgi:Tfp pilus assembly protein PilV
VQGVKNKEQKKNREKDMNKYLKLEARNSKLETLLRDSRGTTLIEVMMASMIFLVGMLALLGMQMVAMHSNKFGLENSEATALVSDQIEKLWAENMDSGLLTAGAHNDPNNPVDALGNAGGKYTRQWTVTSDTADSNSFTIAVTVTWYDAYILRNRLVSFTFMR